MTRLDSRFIEDAQKHPIDFDHGDHTVRFEASPARDDSEPNSPRLELAVLMHDHVIGYITAFTDDEHGVISVEQLGEVVPPTFRTIEGALEQLLPGVADGLATPTFVGDREAEEAPRP
jgi:hypothetical protein